MVYGGQVPSLLSAPSMIGYDKTGGGIASRRPLYSSWSTARCRRIKPSRRQRQSNRQLHQYRHRSTWDPLQPLPHYGPPGLVSVRRGLSGHCLPAATKLCAIAPHRMQHDGEPPGHHFWPGVALSFRHTQATALQSRTAGRAGQGQVGSLIGGPVAPGGRLAS